MSVLRPDMMMKCSIPVVMAGIIAVRGGFASTPQHGLTVHCGSDLRSRRISPHFR